MTFYLTKEDRPLLERFLTTVLERYRAGEKDLSATRADLAEAFVRVPQGRDAVEQYMEAIIAPGVEGAPERTSRRGASLSRSGRAGERSAKRARRVHIRHK